MQHCSSRRKGERAEMRTRQILRSLVGRLPIVSIDQAPWCYDRYGVDIRVKMSLRNGDEVIVPIQVKSSSKKAKSFRRKYPLYLSVYHVILVVVNKERTEEEVAEELYAALARIIESRVTFVDFFKMLDAKEAGRERREQRRALPVQAILDSMPVLGARKKVRFFRPSVCAW